MLERARALLAEAVEGGLLPGAVLGAVTADGRREVAAVGRLALLPAPEPARKDAYYDLASLTKVLFTLREVLRAAEEGLLDLDDPLKRHLPEAAWLQPEPNWAGKTLRELLTHTAGLPAWAPLYTWGEGERLKARVLQEPWPLGEPVYSDLGYVLLGLLLEHIRKRPLARFDLPGGLTWAPPPEDTAPTERCPWRGRLLRGEVHDENAFALGGAAGHAGLFGTASGVLDQLEAILRGTWLSKAALAEMARPHTEERALGWSRKHPGWSGGSLASERSLGHTGFTGTGAWLDLERGVGWVLLANRVHPTRHRENALLWLRPRVGNAILAEAS